MCGRNQIASGTGKDQPPAGRRRLWQVGARGGFTLVELMVASGIVGLGVMATLGAFLFMGRSAAALANYSDLGQQSQLTLDKFTQQVRQVQGLTSYTTTNGFINGLTFLDYDGGTLNFNYDPVAQKLTRTKGTQRDTLLTSCKTLQFYLYQQTLQSNTFDAVTTATATNCKLVEVSFICSKRLMGSLSNSESMQSAKVTIRQ
jgi:prepilin-type N-terminal cleavage/methylation domain-containing protein